MLQNDFLNTWPLKKVSFWHDMWLEVFQELLQWSVTWLESECRVINPLKETPQLISVDKNLTHPVSSSSEPQLDSLMFFLIWDTQ